jgi:CubicO group peptidase (beta-lactamase class C family)
MSSDAAERQNGSVAPGFERVREAFVHAQAGDEGGAQLCVYRQGRKIVDVWSPGHAARSKPYGEQTLSVLMSSTKGMTATLAHMLVARGLLDPDAPVSRYWPEFGAAGKSRVRVRELMNHSVGLSGYEPESGIGARRLLEWQPCVEALAVMEPFWPPGEAYAYHAITYGFLVGEVIRRITGKSVGQFFAEEVAKPLALELWIGLPAVQEHRVAPQFRDAADPTPEQMKALLTALGVSAETRLMKSFLYGLAETPTAYALLNAPEGHAAEIPAGNGVGNARSLARMYAATIGEVDGIQLLDARTVAQARTPTTDSLGPPAELARLPSSNPPRFGLGYELNRPGMPMLGDGSFGHAGAGGRLGFAHPESGLAVGYVCSNLSWDANVGPDPRWVPWLGVLSEIA